MWRVRLQHFLTPVILFSFLSVQPFSSVPVLAKAAQQAPHSSTAAADFYRQPVDQIIVKYKDTAGRSMAAPDSAIQAQRLSQAAGVPLSYLRAMAGGAHVLRMERKQPVEDAAAVAQRLMALPEVEYAEPDRVLYSTLVPDDPQFPSQWHYAAPTSGNYGINLPAAWDITKGAASVVIGVIDTGITSHPELNGRKVPGYDFITKIAIANDGDGRDADPSDPGDWIAAEQCYAGSPAQDSTWHGTHTAGTIGAGSNNGAGVAGINWVSKILPVRVLGQCGGDESDVADGMRWAAGLPVPGVPANPNPAKVLNISLGGEGVCSETFQSAVDDITAAGTTVVVAAGNSLSDAGGFVPANCSGVITVAATNRGGDMALYSNYGALVEIAAPGGETFFAAEDGILSTMNSGKTVPGSPTYAYAMGTSMAAPHVAGVVSLLYSIRPSLTPAEVLKLLQDTATPFPSGSLFCSLFGCGSGIVNAGAAAAALVGKTSTTTTILSHNPHPSTVGKAVIVRYAVAPSTGSGIPTGTVTVSAGIDTCSGSAADGQCQIIFTSSGSKTLVAVYPGDSNYNGSTSAGVTHMVEYIRLYIPLLGR
jgi:serine protease